VGARYALVNDGAHRVVVSTGANEEGTNTGIIAPGVYLRPSKALEIGVAAPYRMQRDGDDTLGLSALLTWSEGG
jgi:hypothetical protein